jgi:hypothetical protein
MATEEQLAAFQTAVASGNIQEAANIAALAGYSPQQVAEYVNANAPILGLGPETGFSGVTAANLDPYFAGTPAPIFDPAAEIQRMQAQRVEAERLKQIELERPIVDPRPPPPVVVQEQGDPLKGALALYDQYLLAGKYPEAKSLLDSTISTYGLNPTESYANMATYLNTNPNLESVREAAENKLFTSENIANFGKLSPAAPVGPAGGIYQRTPEQQAAYASQLASIPVNTAVPLPVMPMSIGPSAAMARIQRTGEMTPEQYYSNIRESVSSGQYTPAQLRQMQQGVGASSQDINVAFGRGMTPIGQLQPGAQPVSVDIPGQYVTTDGGQPKPLSVDISSMPKEQQDLTNFIVGKLPRPTTTAPSMFSPENVRAQLELERLRLQPTPEPPPEEPVAGFAQGGLVSDDINRMLQNQRNAIQRESQSRQMLTNLGAPPVKKFSDGGPAGSSSGVRRLKMSGYQAGGDVSPAMMTPEQLDEFNRNLQRELDEENRRFEKSGGPEFYSAIRPAMEDINERVKQTLELYRMGRATEADVQKLLPSLSEYEIASQFGRTDTGGYRSRDIGSPSRDRLREFIEIQKPTIDAARPDMFPYEKYDPRGPRAQGRVLEMSKGGDVTDEMFVGTAPSEESQQTTGEYIKGLYKENIPVHARVYLETLLGKKDPITAEDFTKDELARIDSLIQKTEAERLGKTLKNQADLQSSLERTIKRLSPQKDIAKKMAEDPDWIAYGELNKKPISPEVANEQFDAWTRFYNKFADQAFVHEDITLIMGDRDPKKVQSYLDEKKQKNKQTTEYLKDRLSKVNQALDAVQGKGLKGAVDDYSAYGSTSPKEMEDTDISRTLGRFNYETLPSGRRVVKDTYDFYNEYRAPMVEEYEKMGPAKKALSVLLEAVKDPVQLPSVLGNAYIGRDGRPVKVEYDPKDLPVKRQEGSPPEGEVNENPYVRMAREERAAQDKAFDSVNRQLSDLLERYKKGNEGITEKDLLPFFPGYNEYDIAQMYGTTTESSVPSMSSKARSFTPEIMSNLRKYDELMQKDFDRLVKEKRLPREVITARTLGLAKGGDVSNDEFIQEMITGTRPTDETTSPGILPPELRSAIDVPLDFANLLIRGTAAVPIGGVAGLYKGITGGKYGTQEGVKEADTEAARMMAKITGEPKTQAAKDVLEFIGGKAQEYKLDAAMPQLLTLPSPGPGAASALMRSYELAETPPLGTVKLAGDKGVKPATPPTDQMGFYSPAEKAVMGLPQDKGTASQMLAQITKTQGVKPVELRATGLEDYLKGKGNEPVTKQEIQDFLTNNRVQVDEVVLGKGQILSPEAKQRMQAAEDRMMEIDNDLSDYFFSLPFFPTDLFYRLRGPVARKAVAGDAEAMVELDEMELPPNIKQLALEFGEQKNEYLKYSKQARRMEKPKFDGYNTSGGTNAREIYLTLPGEQMPSSSPPSVNAQGVLVKPMYATQPKFTAPSPHSVSPEADANRLAHIFLDERKDAKGDKVLFVQEMQSDWAQIGKKKGFRTPPDPTALEAAKTKISQAEQALRQKSEELFNRGQRVQDSPERLAALEQVVQAKNELETLMQNSRLPPAPFVTNTEDWVNLALKRVIKEAVDNDIDTVAFIKGGQAADKYSLRTFVDHISADRGLATGDDLYVSITPKDSLSPHAFYVGPDGIIKEPISADVRSKFLGEPLSKVIGKEAAEKLLSTKIGESQVLRDEGLTLGGKGMEGFYDNILPKTAEKLLKKLGGGKVEPVQLEFGELQFGAGAGRHSTVKENYLGFKITPEMKEMVKTEGLPKFAAGGEVTDFIKRAA